MWKAKALNSGKDVVVKVPNLNGDYYDEVKTEKLRVEAEILEKTSHKNIVKFVDAVDKGTSFCLVTEFVPGETLKDTFQRRPVVEQSAKKYVLTILDALSYLHNLNIVHRDLSWKNILFNPASDEPVIIDLGAAKQGYTQVITSDNTIIGTLNWTAPEIFRGIFTGPVIDIYSVGALLFFLLTGDEPQESMIVRGNTCIVKSPSEINPNISAETSNVVLKAMDLDSSRRFQSADDMSKALQSDVSTPPLPPEKLPYLYCKGRKYLLTRTLAIGRDRECEVNIDDQLRYVSRKHAEVFRDGNQYWIRDAGSTNGTWIYRDQKFQKIDKSLLSDGDLIALCFSNDKGPYITLSFTLNS